MNLIFLILSSIIFTAHSIFLFRAVYFRKKPFKPQLIDRISRTISTSLLTPTFIVGSIVLPGIILKLIIWMPIFMIISANFNKNFVRKHPFYLAISNFIFIGYTLVLAITEFLSH